MSTDTKIRLASLLGIAVIIILLALNYLKSPSDSDIAGVSTTVETQSKEIVKAINIGNGNIIDAINITNEKLGYISTYTSDTRENTEKSAESDYYTSLPQRRAEKARQDSVAKAKKLEKAQKAVEDAQKELEAVKNPNKPVVDEKQNSNNPNANLVRQIGQMIDTKLDAKFAPITKTLDSLKVAQNDLKTGQEEIKRRVTSLEDNMETGVWVDVCGESVRIETDANKISDGAKRNLRIARGKEGYVRDETKSLREKAGGKDLGNMNRYE